jgi:hypothetical protein
MELNTAMRVYGVSLVHRYVRQREGMNVPPYFAAAPFSRFDSLDRRIVAAGARRRVSVGNLYIAQQKKGNG